MRRLWLTDPVYFLDTEVDVNDVSYSLEKLIEQRKAEDTWQVDSFGGVLAARFVHQMRYGRFLLPRGLTRFVLTGMSVHAPGYRTVP
jgi:hypothetical protein